MRAFRDAKGTINALQYTNYWLEWDFIWDRTGLCVRAGCDCSKSIVTCNNLHDYRYDPRISLFYSARCIGACKCVKEPVPRVSGVLLLNNSTRNITYLRGALGGTLQQ